jgi:hypothetical protein
MQATCVICMEHLLLRSQREIVASECGHVFRSACLTRWLSVDDTPLAQVCPQCRSMVDRQRLVLLYFTQSSSFNTTPAAAVELLIAELEKQLAAKESRLRERLQEPAGNRALGIRVRTQCEPNCTQRAGARVAQTSATKRLGEQVNLGAAQRLQCFGQKIQQQPQS